MTVIVAAVVKNRIVMAADGETSYGWQKAYGERPKLWAEETGFVIGAAGCKRTAQVVRHHVHWPRYRPDEEPDYEGFLVTQAVPSLRAGTSGHGVVHNDDGIETLHADLLVAHGTRLAEVSGNGCVHVESCGRMAIGSGYAEALGHLGNEGPWKEADVIEAARKAILTARGVGGPISVIDTKTFRVRTVDGGAQ